MNKKELQSKIMERVLDIQDVQKLKQLDLFLKRLSQGNPFQRKTIDIEELKIEQNWKPVDKKEIYRLIDELDIQEPLEDLLAMI